MPGSGSLAISCWLLLSVSSPVAAACELRREGGWLDPPEEC